MISPPNPCDIPQQENLTTPRQSPMVDGGEYEACSDVYDGNFYRFCRCTCRDGAARNGNCP